MSDSSLIFFWIEGLTHEALSVTGSLRSRPLMPLEIVRRAAIVCLMTPSTLRIRADIKPAHIEHRFVREHMGPIVVRGLWYLFTDLGVGA